MSLNQPIKTTLITKIKATLNKVDSVKQVEAHPFAGNPDNYPLVVFTPSGFDNDFSTVQENFKTYRFTLWAVVSAETFTDEQIYEEILPKVEDEILEKFDEDWDYGTIDGHRVWALLSNGIWGKTEEEKGQESWVQMELLIRVSTNN